MIEQQIGNLDLKSLIFKSHQSRNCGSQIPAFFYRTLYKKTADRHVPTLLVKSCLNREKSKAIEMPEIQNPVNFTRISYRQILENNTFYVKIGKNSKIDSI